jgi:hypothetical protein
MTLKFVSPRESSMNWTENQSHCQLKWNSWWNVLRTAILFYHALYIIASNVPRFSKKYDKNKVIVQLMGGYCGLCNWTIIWKRCHNNVQYSKYIALQEIPQYSLSHSPRRGAFPILLGTDVRLRFSKHLRFIYSIFLKTILIHIFPFKILTQ